MTVRIAAWLSVGLAVLWIGGIASLRAVPLGVFAVSSSAAGPAYRIIGAVGSVLGLAGVGLSLSIWFNL